MRLNSGTLVAGKKDNLFAADLFEGVFMEQYIRYNALVTFGWLVSMSMRDASDEVVDYTCTKYFW